jgi:uncharacterized protein YdaU (DUF1376 family)
VIEHPDPLVTSDVDCTDLDGFMLNVERLMASELVALSSHEVIGAALLLWCRAWKQRPAASLPNDDKVNAAFARMPLARFRKLRAEVLRGFVLCSDGRLYHATLAKEAANAYARKVAFQHKRETDAERLRKWRNSTRHETHGETPPETRFVAEGQGQGQGQEIHSEAIASGGKPPPPTDRDLVFANGVPLLTAAGVRESNARSFLAAQCKSHGERAVVEALATCARESPVQPVPWLQTALAGKPKPRRSEALMDGNIAAVRRYLEATGEAQ